MKYSVLLYYKYAPVEDPQALRRDQYALCAELGIKGRIIVADEGINGTVSGTPDAIEQYQQATQQVAGFEDIEWKVSQADSHVFPKLSVKVRPELVTLGLKQQASDVSLQNKANYIEPDELRALYENDDQFVIIDARNEYEHRVGTFRNALKVDVDSFREFPEKLAELKAHKDKTVVTFCTGGIRCEKFSALLVEEGFENVRQLHGGIHRYADTTGGAYFDGKMYVFDDRNQVDVNSVNPTIISECHHCNQAAATYYDCSYKHCGVHFIGCETCIEKMNGACSETCLEHVVSARPAQEESHGSASTLATHSAA